MELETYGFHETADLLRAQGVAVLCNFRVDVSCRGIKIPRKYMKGHVLIDVEYAE